MSFYLTIIFTAGGLSLLFVKRNSPFILYWFISIVTMISIVILLTFFTGKERELRYERTVDLEVAYRNASSDYLENIKGVIREPMVKDLTNDKIFVNR